MRLYMALGLFDLEDVLHTRRLLEEEAARVAAAERTDEQLATFSATPASRPVPSWPQC
ncbi:hypothetical protein [Amycolatopsis sp. WGS_07]|uniref:hypothetical protein n=1 Tax=Amycolatopsis sp. WGS_07 TaxID=3076764 RepID=UPI0038738F5A